MTALICCAFRPLAASAAAAARSPSRRLAAPWSGTTAPAAPCTAATSSASCRVRPSTTTSTATSPRRASATSSPRPTGRAWPPPTSDLSSKTQPETGQGRLKKRKEKKEIFQKEKESVVKDHNIPLMTRTVIYGKTQVGDSRAAASTWTESYVSEVTLKSHWVAVL